MTQNTSTFYPVYSSRDLQKVHPILKGLQQRGIDVWNGFEELNPGQNWLNRVTDVITHAKGAIIFFSAQMAESEDIHREIQILLNRRIPLFHVLLEEVEGLTSEIVHLKGPYQFIDFRHPSTAEIDKLAASIRSVLAIEKEVPPVNDQNAERLAKQAAVLAVSEIRREKRNTEQEVTPQSVFIVHGHDETLLHEVEAYLASMHIKAIVLRRIGGPAQSLLQKFMQWGSETKFAVV